MSLLTYAPSENERTPDPRTTVVGYDGSNAARSALEEALRRAGPNDAVAVIHAYAPVSAIMGRPYYNHAVIKRQYEARRVLDRARDLAADTAAEVTFEAFEGSAEDVLTRIAEVRDADAIIVGTRRLGRLRGALHSVSQKLLRRAQRPVVAVPADRRRDPSLRAHAGSLRDTERRRETPTTP